MKYRPPISNLFSSGCVGCFCPPGSHQWNLGSSKFHCRGKISHLKCGSFDVARPHSLKCKCTVNSGPWTLDNNQRWTRTIAPSRNLIQSQAPLFNICGCNRYQVGKLSWLQCAKCALTLGVASKSHWIHRSQHKATHTKPLAETLFDTRPRSARHCTNVRSIKSNKRLIAHSHWNTALATVGDLWEKLQFLKRPLGTKSSHRVAYLKCTACFVLQS